MPREYILHQVHCLVVGLFTQLLCKVKFGTEEITNRPKPFLQKRPYEILICQTALIWKNTKRELCTYRSLMIIEAFSQVVIVIVQGIVINTTIHHVTKKRKIQSDTVQ